MKLFHYLHDGISTDLDDSGAGCDTMGHCLKLSLGFFLGAGHGSPPFRPCAVMQLSGIRSDVFGFSWDVARGSLVGQTSGWLRHLVDIVSMPS